VCICLIEECAALLLKHGADTRCKDQNGNTPLDLAKDEVMKNQLQTALAQADLDKDKSCEWRAY